MAFDLIAADGPYAPLADELMLFGRFVGGWDVASTWWDPDGGTRQQDCEWHFAWALGGRAVQDVLFARDAAAGPARHVAARVRRARRHLARHVVQPGRHAVRPPRRAPRRGRHRDRGRDDGRPQPRALELRPHRAGGVPLAGPLLGGRRRHVAAAAGDARDASAALTGAVQRGVAPVRAAGRAVAARAVAGRVDERVLARVGRAGAQAGRAVLGGRVRQARDGTLPRGARRPAPRRAAARRAAAPRRRPARRSARRPARRRWRPGGARARRRRRPPRLRAGRRAGGGRRRGRRSWPGRRGRARRGSAPGRRRARAAPARRRRGRAC